KERSSLLAACALLSGALCPLYGRLRAMSSQRDLLQDQVNLQDLVNQQIVSLLRVLPTNMENIPDEARLRQRRAKGLVYVFRRAVIAVLAANRLRLLAQHSCCLFVWTDGSRGNTRIQVCVGETRGKPNVSRFEKEGVGCVEALDWLTSTNLHRVILSSVSELQDVLDKPDPNSWLAGHSLVCAARSSFAKLMDNLNILMEAVQVNPCTTYLERDSLIQRLACGLQRLDAQALEAGLYERLSTTRNIAILQHEVFELLRRHHAAEAACHSLHLQLAEFRSVFSEMQKDADKAHELQEQLDALQKVSIFDTTYVSWQKKTHENVHEELEKALQREQEARLLLQEHERRLQELSNRLEVHATPDADRNQDLKESPKSLSEALEELKRKDRVLHHHKKVIEDMERDRQWLRDYGEEAK
ncbi:CC171 protein, partial [Erpornis zantholeuca]|nr:CC171 protein [Erpornis zantholeuca]